MRRMNLVFPALIAAAGFMVMSCAGSPKAASGNADFSVLFGKVWKLTEVRDPANTIKLDRSVMEKDGMGGLYTLEFLDDGRIAGAGSPNRYFGPYERGEGNALSFGNVASTLMANLVDPFNLKEHQYFAYLAKVSGWDVSAAGQLELHTASEGGGAVVLVYSE